MNTRTTTRWRRWFGSHMAGSGLSAPLGACVGLDDASPSLSAMSASLFGDVEGGWEIFFDGSRKKEVLSHDLDWMSRGKLARDTDRYVIWEATRRSA